MTSYKDIVEYFQDACNKHEYVNSFAHGSIENQGADGKFMHIESLI